MLDLKIIEARRDELKRSMHCLDYAPKPVRDRALLDLEIVEELLKLRGEK